jgi:hypothetical protein
MELMHAMAAGGAIILIAGAWLLLSPRSASKTGGRDALQKKRFYDAVYDRLNRKPSAHQ